MIPKNVSNYEPWWITIHDKTQMIKIDVKPLWFGYYAQDELTKTEWARDYAGLISLRIAEHSDCTYEQEMEAFEHFFGEIRLMLECDTSNHEFEA